MTTTNPTTPPKREQRSATDSLRAELRSQGKTPTQNRKNR